MDESEFSSSKGAGLSSPSPTNERQLAGDLGDVTFSISNYIKEAMKVSHLTNFVS